MKPVMSDPKLIHVISNWIRHTDDPKNAARIIVAFVREVTSGAAE